MDWERYTGKKSAPRETKGPLNEVVLEKKSDGEWKIIEGKDLGKAIIGTVPPVPTLSWDDVEVTVGGMRVKSIVPVDFKSGDVVGPTPEPLPSFDEVWETIAAELDRKFMGQPITPGSVCEVIRTSMRIMYETLTQELKR